MRFRKRGFHGAPETRRPQLDEIPAPEINLVISLVMLHTWNDYRKCWQNWREEDEYDPSTGIHRRTVS